MPEKFQLAIASIESGNRLLGQQLLAQAILEEPNNESAWLWMSELVSEDKKQYCLEKALMINPNNHQALQALETMKLLKIEPEAELVTVNTSPVSNPEVAVQPVFTSPSEAGDQHQGTESISALPKNTTKPILPKLWLNHTFSTIHALILFEDELIAGKIEPQYGDHAIRIILRGKLPTDLMNGKVSIAYSSLVKVQGIGNSLHLYFEDQSGRNETTVVECKDKESLNAILDKLESRLGGNFERTSAPINRKQAIMVSGVLMVAVAVISTFLYFSAVNIQSVDVAASDSVSLLGQLGPTGVACIAGVLLTVLIILIVYLLVNKPPMNITIARKKSVNK